MRDSQAPGENNDLEIYIKKGNDIPVYTELTAAAEFGIKVDRGTQLTDSQLHKQCCLLHFAAGNIVYLLELQGVRCHDQVIRLQ